MTQQVAFSQRQRLQFIESIGFWEGAIDRPRVARVFGVSENHVTKDFTFYRKNFPGNLDYDLSRRFYQPGKKFRQRFSSGSADEYLSLLRASQEGLGAATVPTIGEGVTAELIPCPVGRVDPAVLKEITRSLHRGTGIRITYQSLQAEEPTKRVVWPHAIIFTGMRWHVRVFDSKYEDFIDLVLQRILSIEATDAPAPCSVKEDVKWNKLVVVTLVPRSKLPTSHQDVIAREFGMERIGGIWHWQRKIRDCFVPYFLESMALSRDIAHLHPKVELIEAELLKTHSFPFS
jgi:predicted DNA-binding transcriptional regulator YafY